MKIAILSMQKVYNYGSVLQAYSLKKIVEDISKEEVEFLNPTYTEYLEANMKVKDTTDYKNKRYINNYVDFIYKKIINKLKFKKFVNQIQRFQSEELKLDDNNLNKKYDLVIEGSDEVFKCTDRVYFNLYGDVKNTDMLITYAASCGSADVSGLTDSQVDIIRNKMKNFKSMSVRDENTLNYVKNFYDGEIFKNLDPVLVGNLNEIKHNPVKETNYMIVYAYGDRIRNKEEIEAIKKYARKNNLKIIAIGAPQYWCDKFISVSPFEMLDYFYYANCVVTDTFHGTIFSIINNTNFVTITRKTNNNKLSDLLNTLNLNDRKLTNMDEIENILNKNIDYSRVKEIIDKEKIKTKDYLNANICKEK